MSIGMRLYRYHMLSIPKAHGLLALLWRSERQQLVYHFIIDIGSVESFEYKLTHSQQELSTSSYDYATGLPNQLGNGTEWNSSNPHRPSSSLVWRMTAYMLYRMGGIPAEEGALEESAETLAACSGWESQI